MSPDDPPSTLTARDLLLDDPNRLEAALETVIGDDHDAIGPAGGVAGMSFVRAQAAQTIGDLLAALEVEELLLGAWMTLGELRTALDETRRDGSTRRVQVAEHHITSAHSPAVELVVNEKPVRLLDLALSLDFTVGTADLVVRAGEVVEVELDAAVASGTLTAADQTLLERSARPIDAAALFHGS